MFLKSILKNKIYEDVKGVHTSISSIVMSSFPYKQSDWKSPKDLNSVSHLLARNRYICICRTSSCSEDMFFSLSLVWFWLILWILTYGKWSTPISLLYLYPWLCKFKENYFYKLNELFCLSSITEEQVKPLFASSHLLKTE